MIEDLPKRHHLKTACYRTVAALAVGLVSFILFSRVTSSLTLGMMMFSFDLFGKYGIFYLHEVMWSKIRWGRRYVQYPGCCIWLTGLPASGKTTIAKALEAELKSRLLPVDRLDGDVVRKSFCADLGFSKEDRDENIKRNSHVSSYLSHSGRIVICAFISPYKDARDKARSVIKNFIEVHVDCPLDMCEFRDKNDQSRTNLYERARKGLIKDVTGIDAPYEPPVNPEIKLLTDQMTVKESVDTIIQYLNDKKLI